MTQGSEETFEEGRYLDLLDGDISQVKTLNFIIEICAICQCHYIKMLKKILTPEIVL